jgi:hypothetical protein
MIEIYEALYKYPHEMYNPLQTKLKQAILAYDAEHKDDPAWSNRIYDFNKIDTLDYRDKMIWW